MGFWTVGREALTLVQLTELHRTLVSAGASLVRRWRNGMQWRLVGGQTIAANVVDELVDDSPGGELCFDVSEPIHLRNRPMQPESWMVA
jgi:hypothetical protein